jgi:hypothetical protein
MNNKNGIARLRNYLVRTRQSHALEELNRIELQLQHLNPKQSSDALDKLSWRTTARPFKTWTQSSNFQLRFSLKRILWSILLLMGAPTLILGITTVYLVSAHERDLWQIQSTVVEIDTEINQDILAPFYLNPRPEDPCNMETVKEVEQPLDISLQMQYLGRNGVSCTWAYYKNNNLIAIDSWNFENRVLIQRDYYQNGNLLATDIINLGFPACVKQRTYTEDHILKECYSEDGHLVSINPQLAWTSPLPPMVYWFFYR